MPTTKQLHHDKLMSGWALKAFTGMDELIGRSIFPEIPVAKQSDTYATITKNSWIRRDNTIRVEGTRANLIDFDVSSDQYRCEEYALAYEVPLERLRNADDPFKVQQRYAKRIIESLARDQEIRIASTLTTSGNLGLTLTVASKWSGGKAVGDSDPIGDVGSAHFYIEDTTGKRANTLILGHKVYRYLKRHAGLLALQQYVQKGLVGPDIFKEVFEVENILVGRGIYNANVEAGTASLTAIWPDDAVLCRTEPAGDDTATLGVIFSWTGSPYGRTIGVRTSVDDEAGGPHVQKGEVGLAYAVKLTATDLGVQIKSVI